MAGTRGGTLKTSSQASNERAHALTCGHVSAGVVPRRLMSLASARSLRLQRARVLVSLSPLQSPLSSHHHHPYPSSSTSQCLQTTPIFISAVTCSSRVVLDLVPPLTGSPPRVHRSSATSKANLRDLTLARPQSRSPLVLEYWYVTYSSRSSPTAHRQPHLHIRASTTARPQSPSPCPSLCPTVTSKPSACAITSA